MPADTYANFYIHPSLNGDKTLEAKRNIYDDVVYAEIFIKGSTKTSSARPKKDSDEKDYPEAWAKFINGEDIATGTPLKSLPNMGPSMILNLNSQGIMSIEDLAALNDSVVIGISGMVDLRKRAQAYMAAMEVDLSEMDSNEELAETIAETMAEHTEEKPKRKRRKRNPETGDLE